MERFQSLRARIKRSWWGMILAEHDTEPAELMGGLLKVAIGAWLLLPWSTFSASRTFQMMAVAPEWFWGGAFIGIGAFHLYALRKGGVHRRWWAAMIGFTIWFSLAFVFVAANPPAIGWLMFMAAACAQGWASVRLGQRL